MAKARGRPQNDADFFAMEVHRVMRAYDCGVRAACVRIARGKKQDKVPLPSAGRKGRPTHTVGSPWKDQKARTLETRYERWLKREKERQKKLTVKIHTPLY